MADSNDSRRGRRKSIYVKQNRSYQILLAVLIVIFIVISVAVVSTVALSNGSWRDAPVIKWIFERRNR